MALLAHSSEQCPWDEVGSLRGRKGFEAGGNTLQPPAYCALHLGSFVLTRYDMGLSGLGQSQA